MTHAEKFKKILSDKGLKSNNISLKMGYAQERYLSRMVTGGIPIYDNHIDLFCTAVGITRDEYDNYGETIASANQSVKAFSYNVTTLNIEAVAGNAIITQATVLENGKMFIPSLQKGRAYFSIGVRGDSMPPKFKSGDMLAAHKIESINDFEHDKHYAVFTLNNGTLLKRARRAPHGEFKGYIEPISENTRHLTLA